MNAGHQAASRIKVEAHEGSSRIAAAARSAHGAAFVAPASGGVKTTASQLAALGPDGSSYVKRCTEFACLRRGSLRLAWLSSPGLRPALRAPVGWALTAARLRLLGR